MKFDLKKNWDMLALTLLAITTAFNYGSQWVSHQWQMYLLSGLVVYYIWVKPRL